MMRTFSLSAIAGAIFLVGCGTQSDSKTDSASVPRSFSGIVRDHNNQPLSGAVVSLGGVQAQSLSGSDGSFTVSDISSDNCQILTISKTGFQPQVSHIDIATAQTCTTKGAASARQVAAVSSQPLQLELLPKPAVLDITSPVDGSLWVGDISNQNCSIPVSGMAKLTSANTYLQDIVLLIDISASTAKEVSTGKTVLSAEIAAAKALGAKLINYGSRVSVVTFSAGTTAYENILTVSSLNSILDNITSETGQNGGTNTANGITKAKEVLVGLGDITLSEAGVDSQGNIIDLNVQPEKRIVLFTDGIPTLPEGSGNTQEAADRVATIEAAQSAGDSNIKINPIVIDPEIAAQRLLTTMPAVMAASNTVGEVVRVDLSNLDQLTAKAEALSFSDISSVNWSIAQSSGTQSVNELGQFNMLLPITQAGNVALNFSVNSGISELDSTLKKAVTLTVSTQAPSSIFADQALNTTIKQYSEQDGNASSKNSQDNELTSAFGLNIKTKHLRQAVYDLNPEARPLPNFQLVDVPSGQFNVEMVYKNAGFSSDIGYIVWDKQNPPTTLAEALNNAQVLFNTKRDVENKTISSTRQIRRNLLSSTVNVPAGSKVALFTIPNGTLTDYNDPKKNTNDPLFSVSSLNPYAYTQMLAFYNPKADFPVGQNSQEGLIIAMEDLSKKNRTDQDYEDVIIQITGVTPSYNRLSCQ